MFEHAIHTLVVDISSNSPEQTTMERMELFRNTSSLYGDTITQTLEETVITNETLKIERLQIDLGTLSMAELQTASVLKRISFLLKEKIDESIKAQTFIQVKNEVEVVSRPENEKEIVDSFLLRGDLPWWVNTNTYPDIDTLLLNTIIKYPEWFRSFLEKHRDNETMKKRIAGQFKQSTLKKAASILQTRLKEGETPHPLPLKQVTKKVSKAAQDRLIKFLLSKVLPAFLSGEKQSGYPAKLSDTRGYYHLALYGNTELLPVTVHVSFVSKAKALLYTLDKLGGDRVFFKDALTRLQPQAFKTLYHSFLLIDEWYNIKKELEIQLITTRFFLEHDLFQIAGMKTYRKFIPATVLKNYKNSVVQAKASKNKVKDLEAVLSWLPLPSLQLLRNFAGKDMPSLPASAETDSRKFIVENAGLCLLAAYLPALFKELNYLKNGLFKNEKKTCRAIYLLEYMATGRQKNPEYVLPLNKILCGVPPTFPMPPNLRLNKKETTETAALLEAIVRNWKVLGNISVNGLRQAFINRKGFITATTDGWKLQVEQKGMDVLLESIPWNYSMIKHAWMKKIITVEW